MQATAHKILQQLSEYFSDTPFQIQYWTGELVPYGRGEPAFTIRIHTIEAVKRAMSNTSLGVAEAYMEGLADIEGDIQAFLKFQTAPFYEAANLTLMEKLRFLISVIFTSNTIKRVKRNVHHHYDLGNDFYRLWLDESMTYTCAYFRQPNDTLEQAQWNKHDHICRKLRLQPEQTLVDIGCGWGAMLFHAAENYGVMATGYTISQEQYNWLQAEIKRRGLVGRVFVELKDYREVDKQFDRWVSIGMAEQVGKRFIPTYFESIKRMLKPGGVGLLHTIGQPVSKPTNPWMQKYIFPGGYLPTLAEMTAEMGRLDLVATDIEDLRLHYGETLSHWYARFSQHIDQVREMYGESFVRMWTIYLNGSAVAFRYGDGRLYQIAFTNGIDNSYPRTRDYIYKGVTPHLNGASSNGVPTFNISGPPIKTE